MLCKNIARKIVVIVILKEMFRSCQLIHQCSTVSKYTLAVFNLMLSSVSEFRYHSVFNVSFSPGVCIVKPLCPFLGKIRSAQVYDDNDAFIALPRI